MSKQITDRGLKFIQSWETLKLKPYDDGYGYKTIGWGHRVKPGERFPKTGLTEYRAMDILMMDIKPCEDAVNDLVKVPLTPYQFDALVSFCFNVGTDMDADTIPEGFGDSALLKKLNEGNYQGAADEFPKWRKASGKVSKGLVKRRVQERNMFLNGIYEYTH